LSLISYSITFSTATVTLYIAYLLYSNGYPSDFLSSTGE
jgi:hypothetical protein